jgi:hypothetical protein
MTQEKDAGIVAQVNDLFAIDAEARAQKLDHAARHNSGRPHIPLFQ